MPNKDELAPDENNDDELAMLWPSQKQTKAKPLEEEENKDDSLAMMWPSHNAAKEISQKDGQLQKRLQNFIDDENEA